MGKRPDYNLRNVGLTTWLSKDQAARLRAIAKAHGVTAATFLRAIVVDALADENAIFSRYISPVGDVTYRARLETYKSSSEKTSFKNVA